MAKEKGQAAVEITEFDRTIEEFLQGLGQAEMKRAFSDCMKKAGVVGRKPRAEWQKLYELFQRKPVGTPWQIWHESQTQKEDSIQ
jgi:hypothetical protein